VERKKNDKTSIGFQDGYFIVEDSCVIADLFYQISDAFVCLSLLTEMSTRNLPGGKGRPAHKADNLTAIYEPTV
jgi:hypothetical protein